ncbi:MAG: hypothetical protein A2Z95_06045 [Gallionellales bacterium GWA2_60_18]|nr:MAG: hypothetical protein A2Z95_06045 [Gallionellales bacterium GWA2_60_18]
MNWLLIETPPKQREVALMAAERRRDVATRADYCVKWLKSQGFSVIRVEPGAVGPRIVIHASPLCKQLDGTVCAYERSLLGERRYSFATRFECEVRWYERRGEA